MEFLDAPPPPITKEARETKRNCKDKRVSFQYIEKPFEQHTTSTAVEEKCWKNFIAV
jgi:hypothetical protein